MTGFSLLIAAMLGALPFAIAYFGHRAKVAFPELQEVKDAYPVINNVLQLASNATDDHTIPGIVADAAYLFWTSYGGIVDDAKAKELTAGTVYHFNQQKYFNTDFTKLDPKAVEQGREIAKRLFGKV